MNEQPQEKTRTSGYQDAEKDKEKWLAMGSGLCDDWDLNHYKTNKMDGEKRGIEGLDV